MEQRESGRERTRVLKCLRNRSDADFSAAGFVTWNRVRIFALRPLRPLVNQILCRSHDRGARFPQTSRDMVVGGPFFFWTLPFLDQHRTQYRLWCVVACVCVIFFAVVGVVNGRIAVIFCRLSWLLLWCGCMAVGEGKGVVKVGSRSSVLYLKHCRKSERQVAAAVVE